VDCGEKVVMYGEMKKTDETGEALPGHHPAFIRNREIWQNILFPRTN
jgi:hypothetical protein